MKKLFLVAGILAAGIAALAQTPEELAEWDGQECTVIFAGKLATIDGSTINSHTCDGVSHTWVSLEKAQDHPAGAMHKRVCVGLSLGVILPASSAWERFLRPHILMLM